MSTNFPDEPEKGPDVSSGGRSDGGNGQPQHMAEPTTGPSLGEQQAPAGVEPSAASFAAPPLVPRDLDILTEEEASVLGKLGVQGAREEISVPRLFTQPGVHPFDEVEWELRTALISGSDGDVVFEQRGVEVPKSWSQLATNVVTSKYFRGQMGTPERERSVRQLIGRVVDTITAWGRDGGYFAGQEEGDAFHAELTWLLLHQHLAFNSPVWFNVGVEEKPQCSACFINSVDDTMTSILTLAKTEGMLFKFGSGTGSNLSAIRSSKELLAGGGTASGPVSFMKGYDAFAGVIKSGGKTRRAAKMVILNGDHPDIMEFVHCKAEEERKAWSLIDAGYDAALDGSAYSSVFFQNANHSVRVTDEFMRAVEADGEWKTRAVTSGEVTDHYRAREVMQSIAEAAWQCGDPGMQWDTTVNDWHTCPNTARINASNPCSEYMFLDDSACNLASLNLMRFRRPDGELDVDKFRHAVRISILAQEIVVDYASYPTESIERNSHAFRPLGLGYANLGAMLMARGLPYDSDEGRSYAGAVTALMCGEAYATSARIAGRTGPFAGFPVNREPMVRVLRKHRDAALAIADDHVPLELLSSARKSWDDAVQLAEIQGVRNSQTTVLAPTGTIAFMMDCDTTGVEPDIALVKYKKLVGGGVFKIVNNTVPLALRRLGYQRDEIQSILNFIEENDTIEGAPELKPEHLAVFDCAFRAQKGERSIAPMGHVRMMMAAQPFISGAISKTVNLPSTATVEDIENVYMEAWRGGLKALAIYRDGCKRTQPLSTGKAEKKAEKAVQEVVGEMDFSRQRRKLPDERSARTHKFNVGGCEGYITVGLYEDGQPGEIFVLMAKAGSTLSGFMDSFATAISFALQYGVPLKFLVKKFINVRFEPNGMTANAEIRFAKSPVDYMFRWLGQNFLSPEDQQALGLRHGTEESDGENVREVLEGVQPEGELDPSQGGVIPFRPPKTEATDAPPCSECGALMVRNGACYACINCGATSGCS
jgi:ribonucleoside-diphosphate reductase alpha chain